LPIAIQAHEQIYFIPLNAKWLRARKQGLASTGNDGDLPRSFPTKHQINLMRRDDPIAGSVTRCSVENHGTANFLDVAMPFRFSYSYPERGINNERIDFIAHAGPIDANKTFVFYIISACPGQFVGIWDTNTTAIVFGEQRRRAVALYVPQQHLGVIYQLAMALPVSKQQDWVGSGPCN
jgi:hypothetical protein